MSIDEDYFVPVRGGVSTKIETLPGGTYTGDIEDVKYLRDKLFAAIKIPQSYLTNLEGGTEDKTTLAQKDIRFARTIHRLQRSLVSELEKMAIVHLYTLGFRGQDLLGFKITLNNPSRLAELQQLEYMKTKFETATSVPEGTFSKRWVAANILGMSDSEFLRNQRETFYDRKYQQSLESIVDEDAEAEALGGDLGGGDLGGGDLGGDLGLGDDEIDLGGDEGGEAEEEDVLLSTPGRREDNPTRHEGAAYKKVDVDKRKGSSQRHSQGPMKRELKRMVRGPEAGTTSRTKFPGRVGIPDLKSLVGLEEKIKPIYTRNEQILFENTTKVRSLVEQMEKKGDREDEA